MSRESFFFSSHNLTHNLTRSLPLTIFRPEYQVSPTSPSSPQITGVEHSAALQSAVESGSGSGSGSGALGAVAGTVGAKRRRAADNGEAERPSPTSLRPRPFKIQRTVSISQFELSS